MYISCHWLINHTAIDSLMILEFNCSIGDNNLSIMGTKTFTLEHINIQLSKNTINWHFQVIKTFFVTFFSNNQPSECTHSIIRLKCWINQTVIHERYLAIFMGIAVCSLPFHHTFWQLFMRKTTAGSTPATA